MCFPVREAQVLRRLRVVAIAVLAALGAAPAHVDSAYSQAASSQAARIEVDVELILAADVSGSMDREEAE
ncbi:MAG: hypothetical protein RL477_1714, partial [Pseudomonadota bacterium]